MTLMKKFRAVPAFFILAALITASSTITGCSRPEKEHEAGLVPDEAEAPALSVPEAVIAEEPQPEAPQVIESAAAVPAGNVQTGRTISHSGALVLTGPLPSGGVNMAELNPANYTKINREAMEGMGMPAHYVAYLAGEKFYEAGNYNNAITEFGRAITLKADYTGAYVYRGNARRKMGDLNRAIEDYTRALNLDSEYAEVYNYRGFVYAQRGDFRRATEDYTRAIRYRANYADAYFNRAYAYSELGNWDGAIADYTQVIKLEPSNAVAYNQRANAWYNKGDESKASADYDAAEKLKF